MSRTTPFAVAFAGLVERFETIQREAKTAGGDLTDRVQFAKLPTVQRLLSDVAQPELLEAHPDAADEYLTSIFIGFRFWEAGQPIVAIDKQWFEQQLHTSAPADVPTVPGDVCYLQWPQRWFWAQIAPDAPHEPLDGVFVAGSGPRGERTVMAVLGLRPERHGFSQLVVRATPHDFLAAHRELRSPPFSPTLEGGNAAGLRSLVSVAELLHLVLLALTHATE